MKRLFTFLFALLSACTFSAYADIVEGTCGDNLTWTLNTKDSTLVIAGTGKMTNYNNYSSFAPWFDYASYITYVTLPDGLTSIGNYAFYYCSGLTSITIPNSVTSIRSSAFSNCSGLTSITIPNSVTSIGNQAFVGCSGLTSITIPNSVTSIGSRAFQSCSGLTSVTIPESVTSIGTWAFALCSGLTSVTIGNSVTSIGDYAFRYCYSLTSVTIGSGVTSIGASAFESCSSLTSITIPNSVTSIGYYAFGGCYSLTSVTIGRGVMSIVDDAFDGCDNIQEVTAYMPTPLDAKDCGINPANATLYVPAEYISTYSNTLWWEDFKEIRAIDADYVVTFYDWDDTVLARVAVAAGEDAIAPADPVRAGYTFIGWDKNFTFVNSNLDVYAQYELNGAEKDLTLVFNDRDDNQILTQTVSIIVPNAPQIAGFTFLYWLPVAEPVDDVITLQAVYESDSPTAAPEVYVNPANPAQKLIRNGQVYILHEEKMYTISGQVVK